MARFPFVLTFLWVSFLSSSLPLQAKLEVIQTPSDVLFAPANKIPKIPIVKKLPHLTQTSVVERGKIEYLIARVRQSQYLFVRNGEMHPGRHAAMHLTRKYRKRIENVKTVEAFIEDVASGSSVSGEPYYLKVSEGKVYRVRDVFKNELKALEKYLADFNEPQKSSEASPVPA